MSYIRATLQDQAGKASSDRLWKHSVAIVNSIRIKGTDPATGRRADAEEFGTGCALRWHGQHLIVTAKHVLGDAKPSDLRVFYCPAGAPETIGRDELRDQDVIDGRPITDPNAVIHRCEWEDLALITTIIPENEEYVEGFDLAENWIDPPQGEPVHSFGFPADSNIPWKTYMIGNKEERILAIRPGMFAGEVVGEPNFLTKDFDSSIHYLIPFADAAEGKHPRGYSGAAVWWESDKPEVIWRPNFKFAGICTSCYKGKMEKVIKGSAVVRFIEETLGPAN